MSDVRAAQENPTPPANMSLLRSHGCGKMTSR
jgi:hypothetical protein